MDQSLAGAQSFHICCQAAEAVVSMQEAGRASQEMSQLAMLGKGENTTAKLVPPAKGALQLAQHLEAAAGLDPDWGKQLVPTGRRGLGSSDKDWKTLGISLSLAGVF